MRKENVKFRVLGFFRSKSSNLEGKKIWDMLAQIGLSHKVFVWVF